MRFSYYTLCLCVAVTATTGVMAAENTLAVIPTESAFFDEIPTITSVTRLPQPKSETPAAVTVIDREMIKASGARDLADVFRLVPGFQVAYPRGHRPAVTYHGLGDEYTRRMQILIDGRSVYGALFGHVSWSTQAIAIEDIERIEVVRGPNTVSYGANAFLGTINIITRHAVKDRGTSIKLVGGDHAIRDALARYGTGFDSGEIRLTAGYSADDGLVDLPDDNRTRFVNVRADLQPSTHDSVLFQAGFSRAEPQEGYYGNVFAPPIPTTLQAHFEQLRWQRRLATDSELTIQFYHSYRDNNFSYLTDPIPLGPPFGTVQLPVSYDGTANRNDVEIQHTFSLSADWRFVWGAGAREDRVVSMPYFSTTDPVNSHSARLFGNTEWRIHPLLVANAGAMLERTDFTGTDLSPRLAINYHISSDDTLRAVWSKARRIPSLFEQYGDFSFSYQGIVLEQVYKSQANLQPETMTSSEMGYLGRFPSTDMTLDVRVYHDKISNLISPFVVPATDLYDGLALGFRNQGNVTVNGIDMELTYRPNHDNRISLTYARMHGTADSVSSDAVISQQEIVDSVPQYSGSLLIMHRFGANWFGSVGYYRIGKMLWLDSRTAVDAYQRLDLRIARRLQINTARGEVAWVIQNAGKRYQDFYSDQFFERRIFVSFALDFI